MGKAVAVKVNALVAAPPIEASAGGYYEGLIGGGDGPEGARSELALRLMGKPTDWARFHAADVSLHAAKAAGRNQVLTGATSRRPAAPSAGGRVGTLVTPSRGPGGPRSDGGDAH